METLELNVAGMTCGGCESSVTRALELVEGVTDVKADHETGKVVVSVDRPVERATIAEAVEDAGYEVLPDGNKQLPVI